MEHTLREITIPLEKTPFRFTPYWKNNDVHSTSLYVEEPEMLRKMGSENEKLVIDIFISRKLKRM